jgi:phosphoglycerate kinase
VSGARIPTLQEACIERGQRWIYSAGFNVGVELLSTGRIDCELDDLRLLAEGGATVAVLSHQGSYRDGSARSLEHVTAYLSQRLGRAVAYFPDCASEAARDRAAQLKPGELALFGNTRLHHGEERNDPDFARVLAALGEQIAVGGFSKAHRANASNVGVLSHVRGVAAGSLVRETELLQPWVGPGGTRYSVAVLGGRKREKTVLGLKSLAATYDLVIPGGSVLNVLLKVRGHDVGGSDLGECDEEVMATAQQVLTSRPRAEIHLPSRVIVRDPAGSTAAVEVADGVPSECAIVDFVLERWAQHRLQRLVDDGGRALLAGTPALYTAGFTRACEFLLSALAAPGVDTLLLGGDTVAELPWAGLTSTGGGAALHYIATGTCPVIDALARQTIPGGTCASTT